MLFVCKHIGIVIKNFVSGETHVSGFLRQVMELGKAVFYLRFYFVVTFAIYFMILHRLALVVILVEFLSIF